MLNSRLKSQLLINTVGELYAALLPTNFHVHRHIKAICVVCPAVRTPPHEVYESSQPTEQRTCTKRPATDGSRKHAFYRATLSIRSTSHGPVSVCLSVLDKSVFYRNGSTNRASFWDMSFLPTLLHCVKRKFGYLQK